MAKITSLLGLAAALKSVESSAPEMRRKVAEKMESIVDNRIFVQGKNADGDKIGTYAASTTRKTGQRGDMKLQLTGKLRSAFGIDRRFNAPDFKFGSERNKAEFIEQGGKTGSINAPVFEFTADEQQEIVDVIQDELRNLGLI